MCFLIFSFSLSAFSSASVHGALATFFLSADNACAFVSCCGHDRCHQGIKHVILFISSIKFIPEKKMNVFFFKFVWKESENKILFSVLHLLLQ